MPIKSPSNGLPSTSEVLHDFGILHNTDGTAYHVRACGSEMDATLWQGWLEFAPLDGTRPALRSPRETTQPNKTDAVYWATGLTPIYLEGALARALHPVTAAPSRRPEISSALNPFSVYRKGESLLRDQLRALAPWHLVRIIVAYDLSSISRADLDTMPGSELVELIVASVRMLSAGDRRAYEIPASHTET